MRLLATARTRLARLDPRYRLVAAVTGWVVLLGVWVLVLLPFRGDENVGAIALAMLLPPLIATGSGPVAAGVAALGTGLAFNFFFTRPYNSPQISSSASIAAFVVYVTVALILAVLAARVREARALADRRARDATLLQSLTVEMIRNAQLVPTLRSGLVELVGALGLRGATLRARAGETVAVASAGDVTEAERVGVLTEDAPGGSPALVTLRAADGPVAFPIVAIGTAFGFLVVDPGGTSLDEDRQRVLESFAGVVALALARARLAEEGVRRRTLEETHRLRTVLLQSVSHDLRTPLTAIKAIASTLLDTDPPLDRRRELLGHVEAEADRLERLVSNLLDLSRIESGTLAPKRELVPVDELVADAVAAAGHALGDAVRVEIALADDLPPVTIDETMVRQVLVNLLVNAARHAGGSPSIRLEGVGRGTTIELRVIDHGIGIPEAERHRIFEPYQRLRPGDRNGSGLGLVIGRGFAEANGGSLQVAPTPGGGATFVVTLPLERVPS